jgi:gas vesicle protein
MMTQTGNGFTKGLAQGLLIGGFVGAGVVLLYAPKSGKELRRDMGRKVSGWQKSMTNTSHELIDKARETAEAVIEAIPVPK